MREGTRLGSATHAGAAGQVEGADRGTGTLPHDVSAQAYLELISH